MPSTPVTSPNDPLLDAELRELLRRRELRLPGPLAGMRQGLHRSVRIGTSQEFRDHRAYAPGDDPRRIDWRAAARSDRLVLRRTEGEHAMALEVCLDAGRNMAYGQGAQRKLRRAQVLAAALIDRALTQRDDVRLRVGCAGHAAEVARATRYATYERALLEVEPDGTCPWDTLLERATMSAGPRTLSVFISDFFDLVGQGAGVDESARAQAQARLFAALAELGARGARVALIQVVHDDELRFPWREHRALRILDPFGRRGPIEGAGAVLARGYLDRLGAFMQRLEADAIACGARLIRTTTAESAATAVLSVLGALAGRTELGAAAVGPPGSAAP